MLDAFQKYILFRLYLFQVKLSEFLITKNLSSLIHKFVQIFLTTPSFSI